MILMLDKIWSKIISNYKLCVVIMLFFIATIMLGLHIWSVAQYNLRQQNQLKLMQGRISVMHNHLRNAQEYKELLAKFNKIDQLSMFIDYNIKAIPGLSLVQTHQESNYGFNKLQKQFSSKAHLFS